uniref:Transmembrane protein 79 n=1 Tax=Latimeria chalumnae TaxID=7897 RepID=H3ADR1_LATCH
FSSFNHINMTTQRFPANCHELKEFDSVKESIADIINQLQDIDPSRLSFSPFLDLDTQISLAPVSDSPESSVEELNSIPDEISLDMTEKPPNTDFEKERNLIVDKLQCSLYHKFIVDQTVDNSENRTAHINGGSIKMDDDTSLCAPQSDTAKSDRDEDHPLLSPSPDAETIELVSHDFQENSECLHNQSVTETRGNRKCCRWCTSLHLKAIFSVIVSLLLVPWILYGIYLFLPIDIPACPDLTSRITFTLRCILIAVVPVILGSFNTHVFVRTAVLLHQRYVTSSVEQFAIYSINMVVMGTFLEQEHLKVIPILAGLFSVGRLIYWLTLRISSAYRGFGFGLTFFPVLAMTAYNLYCLYRLGL